MNNITTPLQFLQWFRAEGPWVLTSIVPDGRVETATFTDPKKATAWIAARNGKSNIYFAVNPLKRKMKSKAKKTDVAALAWLHVDCDARPGEPLDKTLARTLKDLKSFNPPPSLIIMSGGGHQGFWKLDKPIPVSKEWPVERLELYNRHLEDLLAGDHCHNIDRIMRLPFTTNLPNAKKRTAGRVPVTATLVESPGQPYPLGDFEAAPAPTEAATGRSAPEAAPLPETLPASDVDALSITDEWKALIRSGDASAYEGDRSRLVFHAAVTLVRASHDDARIAAVLLDPKQGISAHPLAQNDPRRCVERVIRNARDADAGDFERTKQGAIKTGVPHNTRLALAKLNLDLTYDELAARVLLNGKTIIGDEIIDDLLIKVCDAFGFLPSQRVWERTIGETARRNAFHPIQDYLAELEWDNKKRIDTWLSVYLGADDDDLTRAIGRLWLVAACRRARQPGCKFDEMLVLEGPQGIEKSTALEILAGGPAWFTDDLPFRDDSKIFIERCTGKWIIEFSELSGIKRAQVEGIKATLSRTRDRARLAYAKLTSERPRGCVFAGTTNDTEYLRDETGNRRFWPVAATAIDLDGLRRDRDQLWAEAAAAEATGESIRLAKELWPVATEAQAKRTTADPWMDAFEPLNQPPFEGLPLKIRTADAWAAVGQDMARRTQEQNNRLGSVMRKQKFINKTASFNGRSQRAYVRKEDGEVRIPMVAKFVPADFRGSTPEERKDHWHASTEVDQPTTNTLDAGGGTKDEDADNIPF